MNDATWSLGLLIGLPVGLLFALLLALLVPYLAWCSRDEDTIASDRSMFGWLAVGSALACVGVLILTAILCYPFKAEYHQYRPVSGVVDRIDSRLISSGDKSTETKFVVRFTGSDQQYGCDDTRCSGVDEGDSLTLACIRSFQYVGTDGYNCRFVKVG